MVCLSRPYPLKFIKGCLPQILLGTLLNILSLFMQCLWLKSVKQTKGYLTGAVTQMAFYKKSVMNSQNSQENICTGVLISDLGLQLYYKRDSCIAVSL